MNDVIAMGRVELGPKWRGVGDNPSALLQLAFDEMLEAIVARKSMPKICSVLLFSPGEPVGIVLEVPVTFPQPAFEAVVPDLTRRAGATCAVYVAPAVRLKPGERDAGTAGVVFYAENDRGQLAMRLAELVLKGGAPAGLAETDVVHEDNVAANRPCAFFARKG